jgi:hypothetical protein
MDRQPLTDRLGDRLLAEYGGAAAAYSLRALNGNGDSVVRVRRASDNDEEDFTAEQIELGEMVNWVNSQTVPPLDIGVETSEGRIPVPEGGTSIGTPAAAYSLRNLSTTYTGNVVDVRRSSDNTVASFTAAEVSDGTLEAWVNTDVVKFNPSNTTASGWFVGANISFVAGDDYMQFTGANSSRNTAGNMLGTSAVRGTDGSYSITFDAKYVSGGSLLLGEDYGGADILSVSPASNGGEWASYTVLVNPWNGISTAFTINRRIIFTAPIGSVWQLRNVEVSQVEADGLVSKWYDQSGNDNHATQGTDASQPKIVVGGSLVTNNGNAVVNFQSIDDRHFIFGAGIDLTARTVFYAGRPASTNFQNLLGNTSNSSTNYIRTLNNVAGRPWETEPSSSIFVDGSAYAGGDVSDQGYSLNTFVFDSDATVNFLGGTGAAISDTPIVDASEIILYPSDQSANRTAIEANIGETYGITGIPAYDNTVDGFVETWYDQSGNGNDATQSVAGSQPKIVDGGSLVSGGIDFDGVDDYLLSSHILSSDDVLSLYAVGAFDDLTQRVRMVADFFYVNVLDNGGFVLENNAFSQSGRIAGYGDDTLFPHNAASFVTEGSESLFELQLASGSSSFYVNGSNVNTISATMNAEDGGSVLSIGGGTTGGFPLIGQITEIIIYNADKTSDMANIRGNINDHYNIY